MAPIDTIIHGINQTLSSPAWSGAWTSIGVGVSTTLSIIALRNSRQSHLLHPHSVNALKK